MKEEEIKELFEQFEAIANGVISKELSKKQKHHV